MYCNLLLLSSCLITFSALISCHLPPVSCIVTVSCLVTPILFLLLSPVTCRELPASSIVICFSCLPPVSCPCLLPPWPLPLLPQQEAGDLKARESEPKLKAGVEFYRGKEKPEDEYYENDSFIIDDDGGNDRDGDLTGSSARWRIDLYSIDSRR